VSKETIQKSSGNVFADLGLSYPEKRLAKARLALAISKAKTKTTKTDDVELQELFGAACACYAARDEAEALNRDLLKRRREMEAAGERAVVDKDSALYERGVRAVGEKVITEGHVVEAALAWVRAVFAQSLVAEPPAQGQKSSTRKPKPKRKAPTAKRKPKRKGARR